MREFAEFDQIETRDKRIKTYSFFAGNIVVVVEERQGREQSHMTDKVRGTI